MTQNHVILLLIFLVLPLSSLASIDPTYNFLFNCLKTHTNSSDSNLAKILISKSDSSYKTTLTSTRRNLRFSGPSVLYPLLIVIPRLPLEVSATIICSGAYLPKPLQIKIRSGGHDFEGLSSTSDYPNFIILDLSEFRSVNVDLSTKTAKVESGATLGELYYNIWSKSKVLAFPAGLCPTVGVGGHFSGGGYGTLIRKHGLSIDHVIDAEIVLSDGRILTRKSMGEDLFWAIRGGGGASFGVILSYTVNLVDVPATVTSFTVEKLVDENVTDLVYTWQLVMKDVEDDLFMRVLFQPIREINCVADRLTHLEISTPNTNLSEDPELRVLIRKDALGWTTSTRLANMSWAESVKVSFLGLYLGRSTQLIQTMNRAFPKLQLQITDCKEMSWAESVLYWFGYPTGTPINVLLNRTYKPGYKKIKSDYVRDPIPKTGLNRLWKKLSDIGNVGMALNSYGGLMSRIPANTTPFPHRKGNLYKIQYSVGWKESGSDVEQKYVGMARDVFEFMSEYVSKSPRAAFLNYRDLDIGLNRNLTYSEGRVYGKKYFLGNFERLVKVKTNVDPRNIFWYEQSIPVFPS